MIIRYVIYGLSGLLLEIVWTGLGSLIDGNFSLTGHTYIWMFFIYGLAVFLEPIHDKIRGRNILFRGLVWVTIIYIIEFTSGYTLMLLLGYCPWDYSSFTKYHLMGIIRFDYIPVWFLVGLIFERYHDFIDSIFVKVNNQV